LVTLADNNIKGNASDDVHSSQESDSEESKIVKLEEIFNVSYLFTRDFDDYVH